MGSHYDDFVMFIGVPGGEPAAAAGRPPVCRRDRRAD